MVVGEAVSGRVGLGGRGEGDAGGLGMGASMTSGLVAGVGWTGEGGSILGVGG